MKASHEANLTEKDRVKHGFLHEVILNKMISYSL